MIIACPACATRYVVPDSAIGVDGRTVRCAKCRHSWFQDGPELALPPEPVPPPAAALPSEAAAQPDRANERTADPAWAEPPVIQPAAAEPAAPEPVVPEPAAPVSDEGEPETPAASLADPEVPAPAPSDWAQAEPARWSEPADQAEPTAVATAPPPPISFPDDPIPPPPSGAAPLPAPEPDYDEGYSRFAHEPLFRPRRNPARMWTIAAALFAVVALGAIGATAWFGLPSWLPFAHPLFAEEQPGLKLDFPAKMQGQRPLSDQTWFFEANGTVTNVSQSARSVPTILAVLKDTRGRIVFNAELHSPKRVLAPGESVSINEALVSVPKAAIKAEFGWKPGS